MWPTVCTKIPQEYCLIFSWQCCTVPMAGGQVQFLSYAPHLSWAHIARTSSREIILWGAILTATSKPCSFAFSSHRTSSSRKSIALAKVLENWGKLANSRNSVFSVRCCVKGSKAPSSASIFAPLRAALPTTSIFSKSSSGSNPMRQVFPGSKKLPKAPASCTL